MKHPEQALIRAILHTVHNATEYKYTNDAWEDCDEAMAELWQRLIEGKTPPVLDSLGLIKWANGYEIRQSIKNSDGTLYIQTKDPDTRGWFEMVQYNHVGQRIAAFDLR